jgi:hypothetical protein
LVKSNKKKNFLKYVSRFTNTNIILKFSRATITGTAHLFLKKDLMSSRNLMTLISPEEKIWELFHGRDIGGEGNNLPISGY